MALGFDPNVYRVILTNGRSAGLPSDAAFLAWFVALLLPTLIVALVAYRASGWRWVRDLRESASFGWLKRWVDLAHDVPQDWLAPDLDHGLGANTGFFAEPGTQAACQNDCLHRSALSIGPPAEWAIGISKAGYTLSTSGEREAPARARTSGGKMRRPPSGAGIVMGYLPSRPAVMHDDVLYH